MKNLVISSLFLISVFFAGCSKDEDDQTVIDNCPESFFEDKIDYSRDLNVNTMIYKNKTYQFTNVKTTIDDFHEMYEVEAELNGYELWVRFDPEKRKGCRNTLVTSSVMAQGSFPDKDNSEIGIVMYDHFNYLMNETLQTSNMKEKRGYAEIFYNENEIVVKINNLSLGHMTFQSEPDEELSFHISAPYPTTTD